MPNLTHISTLVQFRDERGRVYSVLFEGPPRKRMVIIKAGEKIIDESPNISSIVNAGTARTLLELALYDNNL